jgi:hypothetical protein
VYALEVFGLLAEAVASEVHPHGFAFTKDHYIVLFVLEQCEGYSRMVKLPSMVSVVLQQTIYNFDVSLDQIFAALADGGCLYVVPQVITKIMVEQGVTYTVATSPSTRHDSDTLLRHSPLANHDDMPSAVENTSITA